MRSPCCLGACVSVYPPQRPSERRQFMPQTAPPLWSAIKHISCQINNTRAWDSKKDFPATYWLKENSFLCSSSYNPLKKNIGFPYHLQIIWSKPYLSKILFCVYDKSLRTYKVALSLRLIKYCVPKTYGGSGGIALPFLTAALNETFTCRWLYIRGKVPWIILSPRAGQDATEKIKNSCLCRELNSDYSAAQPVD
jgi:hypothetical protein